METSNINYQELALKIKSWGKKLGFAQVGISDIDLSEHEVQLKRWLDAGFHGDMEYMATHGMKRARPAELHPGTKRVICVRMNYLPPDASFAKNLKDTHKAYISRYALGRDYHKLMRNKLKKLGQKIEQELANISEHAVDFRPFVDSAPVLERQLADKSGLGWTGKHSLIINKEAGSWFFLGELFVDLPLPVDEPVKEQCGKCIACIKLCPTGAIVEPYVVDAKKCISYLTIELKGAIPEQYRPLIGNRIYGCDDCQLICPWNRYSQITDEKDFHPRAQLKNQDLITLFLWDETHFLKSTEGSPIRRIGHESWLRNIAVALGNVLANSPEDNQDIIDVLAFRLKDASPLVTEHIKWALNQRTKTISNSDSKTIRLIKSIEKGLPRDA